MGSLGEYWGTWTHRSIETVLYILYTHIDTCIIYDLDIYIIHTYVLYLIFCPVLYFGHISADSNARRETKPSILARGGQWIGTNVVVFY